MTIVTLTVLGLVGLVFFGFLELLFLIFKAWDIQIIPLVVLEESVGMAMDKTLPRHLQVLQFLMLLGLALPLFLGTCVYALVMKLVATNGKSTSRMMAL